MTLIDILTNQFKNSLNKVFEKEKRVKSFLPQTILGCRFRAFCGLCIAFVIAFVKALPLMVNTGAYAIAKHRQLKHGENKGKTIKRSLNKLSTKTIGEVNAVKGTGWIY